MWRYIAGGVAAFLMAIAAMLFWASRADTKAAVAAVPPSENAPLGAVDVAAPPEADERTREQRRFSRYDLDDNGSVSKDEYLQSRRKAYARLDLDGNGVLSFDEYAAKAAGKFAGADRDRTGALTPAEFLATRVQRKAGLKRNCPPPPLRANAAVDEAEG